MRRCAIVAGSQRRRSCTPSSGSASSPFSRRPANGAATGAAYPPSWSATYALTKRATEAARTYRIPWAELLAKVYEIDVLACPECGGRMQLIAFIAEPTAAKRILDHLGLDSTGPPLAPSRVGEPDSVEPAPAYDVADPVYEG